MASVEYQNSILWRGEDPSKQKFKPKYDGSTKIARYWPGKAPKFAEEEGQEDVEDKEKRDVKQDLRGIRHRRRGEKAQVIETASQGAAASRLKRLAESQPGGEAGHDRLLRHRVIHDARVLEAEAEEKDKQAKQEEEVEKKKGPKVEDPDADGKLPLGELRYDEISGDDADDNELRALRRERAREIALLKRKEEEDLLLAKEEEDDLAGVGEDEDESEYESESEDDDPRRSAMLKPVFVSKAQRETVREKEILKKEEEEAKEREKDKMKDRKVESKSMLIEEIKRDEEAERAGLNENDASDIELIDDDDEKNEAEEYELWKIRELKRIKRDKEERLDRQKEIEWIMKRRSMTEEEREADDRRLDAETSKRDEAKQFNFLQKYYHRGGFFQDRAVTGEEPLYNRDYHEPLEEEKFDKNLLPQAMQLRRGQFGKKGQVKHSHLTAVDTTDMSAAWASNSKQVQRYQEKMAAAKGVNVFDRAGLSSRNAAP